MYSIQATKFLKHTALFLCVLLTSEHSLAKDWLVETPNEYKKALKKVKPGDKVILANGTWQDFEVLFKGNGTPEQPIELTAQTKGKVLLTGQSNLRLAGRYLIVSGLVFKNGYTPSNEVISFRT